MTPWTDLEAFIIHRWNDASEFRDAVKATEGNSKRPSKRSVIASRSG